MSSARFIEVALPVPLDQTFTYALAEEPAAVGARVRVPWKGQTLVGVVTAATEAPPPGVATEKIRPVAAILDAEPLLDAVMLELVRWTAAYYQAPIGETMRCALPPAFSPPKRPRARSAPAPPPWQPRPRVERLNPAQAAALAAIIERMPPAGAAPGPTATPLLLHGVTGSGKTAVYLEAIAAALERGHSALLLVPEIGLTPAVFADFEQAFPGQVAIAHSGLRAAERALQWRRLHAGEARVGIGTRSAVFAPMPRLGLIVVDEEHDASFKQLESPRYHARDLAVLRGRLCHAAVVLGSATPSLETATRVRQGKYARIALAERIEQRPLPEVRIVDMGEEFRRRSAAAPSASSSAPSAAPDSAAAATDAGEAAIFSEALLEAFRGRLEAGEQALLLINRRGWAPVVLCRACGAAVMCRDCAVALTFHRHSHRLLCHFCGYACPPPTACPSCGSLHLYQVGAGSEQVEARLARALPGARVARLDRDTARSRGHFERVLGEFRAGRIDILVGTQMIAKGHDVPGVTLVGVLQADLGLTFPDFRAAERTFQLLTQVAGRAGRGERPGTVLLQVLHPGHYAVESAAHADFEGFYEKEANFRRWMHYPPFAALAMVQLRHRDEARLRERVDAVTGFFESSALAAANEVRVLGPAPALVARLKTEYRVQFLLKSASRRALHVLLRGLRAFARERRFGPTELVVDVDPLNL